MFIPSAPPTYHPHFPAIAAATASGTLPWLVTFAAPCLNRYGTAATPMAGLESLLPLLWTGDNSPAIFVAIVGSFRYISITVWVTTISSVFPLMPRTTAKHAWTRAAYRW